MLLGICAYTFTTFQATCIHTAQTDSIIQRDKLFVSDKCSGEQQVVVYITTQQTGKPLVHHYRTVSGNKIWTKLASELLA